MIRDITLGQYYPGSSYVHKLDPRVDVYKRQSKWSVWSLTKYAVDGFIDFAVSPLKFVGVMGGITAFVSFIYFVFEILKTLIQGKDTPGYASTICLILFFGGLITAILSLMGEYIGRMYMETKRRPVYIEKESNIDEDQRISQS